MDASSHGMLLGMDPFWLATFLFIGTYLVVMTEKINRAVIALLGAGALIICGVLSQAQAIASVDFNTLGLLAGMMVIVHVTSKTGLFQSLAIWAARRTGGRPWPLLLALSILTALASALLDNVTTVLLVTPITLSLTKELKVPPYPYLFTAIFASNIGGTATLIGDPPNIMIGSATGLTFNDFILHLAPISAVVFIATLLPIYIIWGRKLHASDENRARILAMNAKAAIKDRGLLRHCLAVIALVIGAFVFAHQLHLEPATIAMTGAALLLFLENLAHPRDAHHHNVHKAFAEAEWVTLFFFVGLFILVAGIEHVGLIRLMADAMLHLTGGDMISTTLGILWGSALLSALIDNIPFVATMIPMIKSMAPALGGNEALMPLWWALSLGACLGGNGTLIGASANLVVAGLAEREGVPIRFLPFMKHAFGLMLMSIALCTAYIYLRYLA